MSSFDKVGSFFLIEKPLNRQAPLVLLDKYSKIKEVFFTYIVGFLLFELLPIALPILVFLLYIFFHVPSNVFVVLFIISIIISTYFIYIVFFKFNFVIKVRKYSISSNYKLQRKFKVLVISDLHIGRARYNTNKNRLMRIIKLLNKLHADCLVICGDIVDKNVDFRLLQELKHLKFDVKIAVLGNHDFLHLNINRNNNTQNLPWELIKFLEIECNIKVLVNQGISLRDDVFIAGINDLSSNNFDVKSSFRNSGTCQYKILLSHQPDVVDYINSCNHPDLIISGHNHGGAIRILNIFTMPIPSKYKFYYGFYKITNSCILFVSSGIGHSATKVRIGTFSEIAYIEIY
ncbi:MAG: metallophosphoesterase [Candidatus Dojkabacteria bacterium]|nr:metallophosphoesterase [Candidatus Dojkabacteria bacterium]